MRPQPMSIGKPLKVLKRIFKLIEGKIFKHKNILRDYAISIKTYEWRQMKGAYQNVEYF